VRAALAVVLVVAAACGGSAGHTALPDVTVRSVHDGDAPLDVGALRGPAVINLWATWCAPCRKELPAFQQVSAARRDVRFIGVDIAEDAAKARDYLAGLGVTFDQYLDDRGELTDALGTAVLPVTLVVDRSGRIATEHIGPMTVGDLEQAIGKVTG
jgi:cytochrome c biogenesis protein CcmG, thiol:disulfide interchange protein DsbE